MRGRRARANGSSSSKLRTSSIAISNLLLKDIQESITHVTQLKISSRLWTATV
jgi:hypothetical protein